MPNVLLVQTRNLHKTLCFTIRNACRSLREDVQNRREILPIALQKLELHSNRFSIDLGASKRSPERLGRPPGTLLGHSWGLLRGSWGALGSLLDALGRSWGALGVQNFLGIFKNRQKN